MVINLILTERYFTKIKPIKRNSKLSQTLLSIIMMKLIRTKRILIEYEKFYLYFKNISTFHLISVQT